MKEAELLANNYRKYCGNKIDIYFNSKICIHSTNCVNGLPKVFNLKNRPWINADGASTNEIMKQIDKCPSKALQYVRKD